MYDDADATDRFLVADEVGMGKTLVARGVIAGAIERLISADDINRIDIVYICSNADIARQNISKLWVGDGEAQALSTRLTLLATQLKNLNRVDPTGRKTINLVAFTPGTSFDQGNNRGRAEERALLWWLLWHVLDVPRAQGEKVMLCSACFGWGSTRTGGSLKPPDSMSPVASQPLMSFANSTNALDAARRCADSRHSSTRRPSTIPGP